MANPGRQSPVSKCARSAFTLIELLVVVAIIALLIAILVPSLAEARDQAKSAVCLANMQDMGKGVNMFAAAHRGRFQIFGDARSSPGVTYQQALQAIGDSSRTLFAYEGGPNSANPAEPNLLAWPTVLAKEGGAKSVRANADWGFVGSANAIANKDKIRRFEQLICPSDKVQFGTIAAPSAPPFTVTSSWYYGFVSYVINLDIVGGPRTRSPLGVPTVKGVWKDSEPTWSVNAGDALAGRLDRVIRPGEVMMFADGGPTLQKWTNSPGAGGFSKHCGTSGVGSLGSWNVMDPQGPLMEYVDMAFGNIFRHERHRRNSVNVTYVDGHGGFARKLPYRAFNNLSLQTQQLPTDRYLPKVRVSPYNSGQFP